MADPKKDLNIHVRCDEDMYQFVKDIREHKESMGSALRRVIKVVMNKQVTLDETGESLEHSHLDNQNSPLDLNENLSEKRDLREQMETFEGHVISTIALLSKKVEVLEEQERETQALQTELISKFNTFASALSQNQKVFLQRVPS